MYLKNNQDIVLTIPAYEPNERMLTLLNDLKEYNYKQIILVDDGSGARYDHFFKSAEEIYGCDVIHHDSNGGYGAALKTGAKRFCECYADDPGVIGFIQCDCDGQHAPVDIARIAQAMRSNEDTFIIGERQFDDNVPWKSRFGNRLTGSIFSVLIGIDIKDTQCGLRGIPKSLGRMASEINGDHMEYTTSLLIEISSRNNAYQKLPIETIYIDNNDSTHFDPIKDSIRIYSLFFKYLLSSFSSFVIDIVVFTILFTLLKPVTESMYIPLATYGARIISCLYTYLINKKYVFKSNSDDKKGSALRFIILAIAIATASGFITKAFVTILHIYETVVKVIVDTFLFFISFRMQHRWVFAKEDKR